MTIIKTIGIKRRINPDDELIHFIRHNSNRRRHLWNKFVEEYRQSPDDFHPDDLRESMIYEDIDSVKNADDGDPIREMYCADLPLSVYKDVKRSLKQMDSNKKKYGMTSTLKFKEYDPFKKSFSVRTQNMISTKTGRPKGKVHFKNVNQFEFRASYNYVKNVFNIHLLESISDEYDSESQEFVTYDKHSHYKRYSFNHQDIKKISFIEELGKFYIILACDVTYYICKDELKCRAEAAGIDLGIHNPVTIHNGSTTVFTALEDKALARMQYYERVCERLKKAMYHKLAVNNARNAMNSSHPVYSNRYRKLQRRLRKYWKKIVNIRRDWRFKLGNLITTSYRCIVVDEFTAPDNRKLNIPKKIKDRYKHYNCQHAMSLFMETLRHMAAKNGCIYLESPKYTARRCSVCNHVNPKIPLAKRTFVCENCNQTLDRDVNAAINCYDFYFSQNH
jgi:putative transposase